MIKILIMNYTTTKSFIKILKKKYRGSGFLNQGKFPRVWNFDFISIHNSIILSSVIVEKNYLKDWEDLEDCR